MNLVNQEILNQVINQDYASIDKTIEGFLKNQVSKNNSSGLIFGLSGGVDSAVTSYLCHRALPNQTLALLMPDSKISPKTETEDAIKMVEELKLDYKLIDINPIVNQYAKDLRYKLRLPTTYQLRDRDVVSLVSTSKKK